MNPHNISTVSLNSTELTIADVIAVTRHLAAVGEFQGLRREHCLKVRAYIEENWFAKDAPPRYGFNTGIGSLKSVRIDNSDIRAFQKNYIKSHCVGVGDPLPIEVVRGAMLLQANALSKGFSGVRPVLIDKLIEFLNKGVHPVVPGQGSLGASGDLAPLTHIASVIVGEPEAEIWVSTERRKLRELMSAEATFTFEQDGAAVTFQPLTLAGKEAISLTNATSVMLSIALHVIHDAEVVLKNADISAALSLEAMMCEQDAFAQELHEIRAQEGQRKTAANLRALTRGSRRMTPEARSDFFERNMQSELHDNFPDGDEASKSIIRDYKRRVDFQENRVQDSYSLRCVPQVHGACKDAFNYAKGVVERELTAVTDNPVIFKGDDGHYRTLSGGNFHGQPLAMALDFLAIALAEIANIADRRMFRLLSPRMSFGLPNNLSGGQVGLNSGLMMVQYTAAQLVSENKILTHPASVDSIPTSDNQEDHVSMGLTAARKVKAILSNVKNVLAMEFLCASQAIHLSSRWQETDLDKFPLGAGTALAFRCLVSFQTPEGERPFQLMTEDRYLHERIKQMEALCSQGAIIEAVAPEVECLL